MCQETLPSPPQSQEAQQETETFVFLWNHNK